MNMQLEKWDKMKSAVAECHSVDEIAQIRNQAEAYRYALRQAKESPEVIRKAEEIKLRAERRAGELLKDTPKAKGGNPNLSKPTTGSETLTDMGISRDQSSKWQKIANIPEEKFENYLEVQKELSTSGALKIAKQISREEEINRIKNNIEKEKFAKPSGLFDVIAIDPPWNYGGKYNPEGRRISSPYPEMSIGELKEIEIPAKDDSVLWLWTTHKFIWDAKFLLDHWGFDYKLILTWNKEKMGIGNWLRMQCEFCLMGVKGSPLLLRNDVRDIIIEPRREHSRKPDAFYEIVETLNVGKKLDYFSREQRKGWESYGAEIDKF
jgi:N6-adenosine-specific RNA methylase IME4